MPDVTHARLVRTLALAGLLLSSYACTSGSTDGSCAVSLDCGEGGVCVGGQCIVANTPECTTNEDCALGEVCLPDTNTCGEPPLVSCATDTECPDHQRCNQATGVCVDGVRPCTGADPNECPGRHCDTGRQVCVDCLTPAHCTAPEICVENSCIDPMNPGPGPMNECVDDASCNPPMTICEGSMCVLGCGNPGGVQCMNGDICDTNTGRCVSLQGPCTMDSECSPPMTVCETGQCIPGCHRVGGLQCPGGEVCNPSTGRCRGGGPICTSDLDCNAPMTVCNLFSGACEPGCGTAGCTAPETCNTATGHCEGGQACSPDRYEPNDTRTAAAMINGGLQSGLTLCPGDEDFFQVALGTNDSVDITVDFVHGEGNIDIQLLDPNGTVVQSSATQTGQETISLMATTAGVYTVRVYLTQDLGPNPGNQYTMNISANVAACPQDQFEDNDEDFGAPLIFPGSHTLNVCVGDEDYFDVILTDGETLEVEAVFSHAEGDIDIQILGLLGIPLASSASSTDNEQVSYTANNVGFFTIRVALFSDTGTMPGNPYQLNINVTSAPPMMCTADAQEPNDTAAAASSVGIGNHANLHACTDDDFYAFSFSQGDDVSVAVSFSDAEGDIDIELLNPSGTVVASGTTNTDDENISYTVATAGTHRLRVFLYGDAGSVVGNPYTLNVGVAGAATCSADTYEPNNTQALGASLTSGTYANLTSCVMDDDFYTIPITNGSPFVANVTFVDAEGDIDVELLDPSGTIAASSASATDNEQINYTPTVSGNFSLRVYLYGDAGSVPGNTYTLSF